jgi:hypothetical protein
MGNRRLTLPGDRGGVLVWRRNSIDRHPAFHIIIGLVLGFIPQESVSHDLSRSPATPYGFGEHLALAWLADGFGNRGFGEG